MMKQIILTVVFITLSVIIYAGGGWPQPKGKGYFKLSEWWVVADQHFSLNGGIDPNVTTGLYNTTFYGEYGLTDRFTVIANIPLLSRSVINNQVSTITNEIISEGDALNSIGDIDFSLKYGLFQSTALSVSASLTLGLPLGTKSGGRNNNLQTGDGEFNQIFRLDAGIPLGNAYTNVYYGFNNRTGGFSDEHRYGAEAGVGLLNRKLWFTGRFDVIKSLNNVPSGQIEDSFFANNAEVTSLTAEISYEVAKNVGVSVSYGSAIDGRIVYASPSYSVGVFIKI